MRERAADLGVRGLRRQTRPRPQRSDEPRSASLGVSSDLLSHPPTAAVLGRPAGARRPRQRLRSRIGPDGSEGVVPSVVGRATVKQEAAAGRARRCCGFGGAVAQHHRARGAPVVRRTPGGSSARGSGGFSVAAGTSGRGRGDAVLPARARFWGRVARSCAGHGPGSCVVATAAAHGHVGVGQFDGDSRRATSLRLRGRIAWARAVRLACAWARVEGGPGAMA